MNAVLIGVMVYIGLQLLVGAAVARRIRNQDDYLLAGRSLGAGLAMLSIFATWFGAETCIGAAGAVYEEGLAGCSADPFGYCLCLFLMGLLFAVPLYRRRLTTLADLFRQRFSPRVERVAVLMMVPTSVMWAAAQIRAFGQILSASSALTVEVSITVAAAIVILYTVSGGLMADVITDLIQGLVLIAGLVVVLVAVVGDLGGVAATARTVDVRQLNPFGHANGSVLGVVNRWAIPICGSVVAQELVARVVASRSARVARRSSLAASGLYLCVGIIPVTLGLVGATVIPDLEHGEQILPLVAQRHLSTIAYVLFAGALASAILSTVDSALLAASSLTTHNVISRLVPDLSERGRLRLARGGVAVFGVIAYVLALHSEGVYALVEEASAFGSAGIFTIVVFGLFTRMGSSRSALVALVTGMSVWLLTGYVFDLPVAYLASLACAGGSYLIAAAIEHAAFSARPAPAPASSTGASRSRS